MYKISKSYKGNVEDADFLQTPPEIKEKFEKKKENSEIVDTGILSDEPFVQEVHFPKILVEDGENQV